MKVAQSDNYDQQDDTYDAFQYNGSDLPKEFLLAKLAFTDEHEENYRRNREDHKRKDDDRRNTGFNFNKADMYHDTMHSFN